MSDPAQPLKDLKKDKEFLVGIDSDGCAFDTMEIKHKECFIPNIIKYWDLQAVSKYAREAGEFVNLYSKWRGINRWPALLMVFDLLDKRPEVGKRGVKPPTAEVLRKWVAEETKLSNTTLKTLVQTNPDPILQKADLVRGRQQRHRRHGPRRPAVPVHAREPGEAGQDRRRHRLLADPDRGALARVAGARHRRLRQGDRRPGNGQQVRASEVRDGRPMGRPITC